MQADPAERVRDLCGDELIAKPLGAVTHAITIRRPAHDVWPWLAQMGSDRAGWYAYDFIDNGVRPSAERIVPEFQKVGVADPDSEFERFKVDAIAGRRHVNWPSAFQKWCLNSEKWRNERNGNGKPGAELPTGAEYALFTERGFSPIVSCGCAPWRQP